MTQITDSVVITTPLGSSVVQLTQFDNKVTLDKGGFVQGINTITVGYKDQIQTVQILVRNPVVIGPTQTNLIINDILNEKPAPGVPDYINYSLANAMFINFPTEEHEYIQVSVTYGLSNLVLGTNYYALNDFIINNQINFTIPGFLPQLGFTVTISYSGDSVLEPATQGFIFQIHDYTPEITVALTNTVIGMTNVLNTTTTYLNVKIEGYLPPTLSVTIELVGSAKTYTLMEVNITNYRQTIPVAIINTIPTGTYQLQESFTYTGATNPILLTQSLTAVNKIGLIIRTNTSIFTVGNPILFDFFCYDPTTFSGVDSLITMMNGTIKIMTIQAVGGHAQQIMIFRNIDTSKIQNFTFEVSPLTATQLYTNDVNYYARFYHNTSIDVQVPTNVIETIQLVTFKADTQ